MADNSERCAVLKEEGKAKSGSLCPNVLKCIRKYLKITSRPSRLLQYVEFDTEGMESHYFLEMIFAGKILGLVLSFKICVLKFNNISYYCRPFSVTSVFTYDNLIKNCHT